MRVLLASFLLAGLAASATASSVSRALPQAVDHGQMGQTWPVAEPDLLLVIKAKLDHAKATGKLDDMNRKFAEKVKSRVMRPVPVAGISAAEDTRSWEYDPAIRIDNDIRDHKGHLIAVAGQRVNPLSAAPLSKKLVFIDGDDPAEVAWAMRHGSDALAKIICVAGSPIELMKVHQRRFYFDQEGRLTGHFGIRRTPALVEQRGDVLLVTEQAISRKGKGA
ncbi:MAG: type-F conjugative transfer system protein TraW [Parvularcula sp.]|nr:type-F conjugative transfer system protein TraW [Parvularcula sp.]